MHACKYGKFSNSVTLGNFSGNPAMGSRSSSLSLDRTRSFSIMQTDKWSIDRAVVTVPAPRMTWASDARRAVESSCSGRSLLTMVSNKVSHLNLLSRTKCFPSALRHLLSMIWFSAIWWGVSRQCITRYENWCTQLLTVLQSRNIWLLGSTLRRIELGISLTILKMNCKC